MTLLEIKQLEEKAKEIRKRVIQLIYEAGGGHIGGALSATDLLVALYYRVMKVNSQDSKWEERDKFILSKGHSVEPYWCILADLGFFPKEELQTFQKFGTRLIAHPNNKVPGVEMNTGALGHGLSIAVGMGIAAKMDEKETKIFTLMGDGELAEGSIWEAAMSAAHYKLDNLVAIIDRNKLQISGNTESVMRLEPLAEKWKSFGWHVEEIDGNSMEDIIAVLEKVPKIPKRPTLIIAHTTKGKGVSFIENRAEWHHKVPTEEEYKEALREL